MEKEEIGFSIVEIQQKTILKEYIDNFIKLLDKHTDMLEAFEKEDLLEELKDFSDGLEAYIETERDNIMENFE